MERQVCHITSYVSCWNEYVLYLKEAFITDSVCEATDISIKQIIIWNKMETLGIVSSVEVNAG